MRLRCAATELDLSRPVVMGILNVTPDSFSDGGRYLDPQAALDHARRMLAEGATLIDVGGESTRPGAAAVSAEEEIRRVVPVIEALRRETPALISVDTSKPEVIRAAAAAGAHLINDVRGLRLPGALEAAAATPCAVCLMHMQGEPGTMQHNPHYDDVVAEVRTYLQQRVAACAAAGIARERIVLDPGFGFGKTVAHNLELMRRLPELLKDGLPLLLGMSRKSTLGALTGRGPEDRLAGSLALALLAAQAGAGILRVHDVAATVDVLKVLAAVQG